MRKVEEKMLTLWRQNRTGKASRNTECRFTLVGRESKFGIFLFGNLIAYKTDNCQMFSLAGKDTVTTRSRLRALGLNLVRKNGVTYRNGKPWRGDF